MAVFIREIQLKVFFKSIFCITEFTLEIFVMRTQQQIRHYGKEVIGCRILNIIQLYKLAFLKFMSIYIIIVYALVLFN